MAYQLHIWGPAFGLPSIDAECIAATAYFTQLLPSSQWVLVVAHDLSISPTGNFPVLHHNSKRIAGFNSIVKYLEQNGLSLDEKLSSKQRAECVALNTHILTHALPLIDATLYSSSSNYTEVTRVAYTNILPIHANYTIPPARHALAESRTSPLGLSVDDLPQEGSEDPRRQLSEEPPMISNSPSLIFKSNAKVQAAIFEQQSRARFRIEALLADLVESLEVRLRNAVKRSLLGGETVASVDCLAFGYFSLLLYPDLPKPWVSDSLRSKHEQIVTYTENLRKLFLGDVSIASQKIMKSSPVLGTSTSAVEHSSDSEHPANRLPWRISPSTGISHGALSLVRTAVNSLVNPAHQALFMGRRLLDTNDSLTPRYLPYAVSTSLSFFAAFVGYMVYGRLYGPGLGEKDKYFGPPRPRIYNMGAAGKALAAFR